MKLLEQTNIAAMKLRNRIYMAPMERRPNRWSFRPSDPLLRGTAKGGFGSSSPVPTRTMQYEAKACNVIGTAKSFEQMNFLARRVHNHGALCIQLTPRP